MTGRGTLAALRDRSFADDEPVKLSICCIAFNHAAFIQQCIDGFLDQRCDFRIEVVIYDDASTDQTADIIRDYAAKHPTIFRTILMQDNQFSKGVNPYFGYVFPAARGEYLAICDGDDYWTDPAKLAKQVTVLEAEPGIALTFGTVRGVDESGAEVSYTGSLKRDLTSDELKTGPSINTLTSCFRNIYRGGSVSLYIRTATIGDLMVWAMLGYHGGARFMPDLAPASYRLRAGGLMSMQARDRQIMMTVVAQMHVAGYHAEQGDISAFDDAMLAMTKQYNAGAPGALHYKTAMPASLRVRLVRWRKTFTTWRKTTLRRVRKR